MSTVNQTTVKLSNPFEGLTDKRKWNELTIRRCTFGDLEDIGITKAIELEELDKFKLLAARLTGLAPEDISQIDMRDWAKISKGINSFLGLSH